MSGIWKYAADIIERAGATALTLYALIVLCGFVLIYNATKRTSAAIALGSSFGWFIVATLLLVMFVEPRPPTNAGATPSNVPAAGANGQATPQITLNVSGQPGVTAKAFALDLGDIPAIENYQVELTALSDIAVNGAVLTAADPAVEVSWDHMSIATLGPTQPGNFHFYINRAAVKVSPAQYDFYLESDNRVLAKVTVTLRLPATKHVVAQLAGVSGVGEKSGQKYTTCVAPPDKNYALIAGSVKISLTGDRACNAWSTCETAISGDQACLTFSMQGHSEFNPDVPHLSTGRIEADYSVRAQAPSLKAAH